MTSDHPRQFARWVRPLTTVGVIGLSIALLLPVIQRAREAARRMCTQSEAMYQFPGEFLRSETLVSERKNLYQVIAHINRAGQTKVIEYAEIPSKDPGKPMDVSLDWTVQRFRDRTTIEVIDAGQYLSDAALSDFALLSNLEWLSVGGKHITDAGTKHLAAIPSLRTLTLDQTEITAAGLAELDKLPLLATLKLIEPGFGDEAADALLEFPALANLEIAWYFREAKITPTGLVRLLDRNPNLEMKVRVNGKSFNADAVRGLVEAERDWNGRLLDKLDQKE